MKKRSVSLPVLILIFVQYLSVFGGHGLAWYIHGLILSKGKKN